MADEKVPEKVELTPEQRVAATLNAIGEGAFSETGGDIWSAGQPLAGDPAARHAAEAKAAAEKSASTEQKPETKAGATPTEGGELIAGKWKTKEEAEKGIHELIGYTKTALDRAEKADADRNRLIEGLAGLLNPQVGNGKTTDPWTEWESVAAVPKEVLQKTLDAYFDRKLADMSAPLVAKQQADQEIIKLYPDYVKEFDNLTAWVEQNPEIKADIEYAVGKGEHLMARKYAWRLYDQARKALGQEKMAEKVKERTEKRVVERADAGLLGGTGTGGQLPAEDEHKWPDAERMKYLKNLYDQGHQDPLLRETIGKMLDRQGFDKA